CGDRHLADARIEIDPADARKAERGGRRPMTEVADSTVRQADTVELRMDARPENLVLARLALGGIVARTSLEDDAVADLKLAVTEACTNSIEHAYAGDHEDNEVVVRFLVDDDALSVEVQDWGTGF